MLSISVIISLNGIQISSASFALWFFKISSAAFFIAGKAVLVSWFA